jgi:hypothetical protein
MLTALSLMTGSANPTKPYKSVSPEPCKSVSPDLEVPDQMQMPCNINVGPEQLQLTEVPAAVSKRRRESTHHRMASLTVRCLTG